ncbi:MAG: hypothetical protein OSA98_06295 [Rubripirellula sp.]|nr:hypothetical protein [Rubripirellula sp.]
MNIFSLLLLTLKLLNFPLCLFMDVIDPKRHNSQALVRKNRNENHSNAEDKDNSKRDRMDCSVNASTAATNDCHRL